MKRRLLAGSVFSLLLLCGAVLSACGGGGGGGSLGAPGNIVPPSSPTPCPQGYVGTPPSCQQESSLPGQFTPIAVPSATALPSVNKVSRPDPGTYGGTILIPAANPAAQVEITLQTGNPTGVTIESRLRGMSRNARIMDSGAITPLIFITMLSAGDVVFTASSNSPGFPGFVFSLPSPAPPGPFYLAYLEGGSIWTTVAGPANASPCAAPLTGNCVTLQPQLPPSLTISPTPTPPSTVVPAPGAAYLLLYTGGVVPSTAPSSSPGGQPTSSTSAGASPSAPPSGGSSALPSSVPSSIPSGSSSASPVSSPSSGPTVAPTGTRTATASPTTFSPPPASPTPTPNTGTQYVPKTLTISGLPSGQSGTAINATAGTFTLTAYNASSSVIGTTFANPVTLTSSDSTGAAWLAVNFGAAAQSVQVNSGSDFVSLVYTGAAVGTVTISASASTASTVTETFSPTIAPIVTSTNEIDLYAPSGGATPAPGSTFQFTASQAGYTGSFGYPILASIPAACNAFVQSLTSSNGSSGTTFTVTASAAPTPGSCVVPLSGFGTTTTTVTLTYSTFGVTLH